MARALALTQLLIICIGAFILHLLVKVHDGSPPTEPVAHLAIFLARHALWLFAIPILYAAAGAAFLKTNERGMQILGVILTVIILMLLGFPICYHLF